MSEISEHINAIPDEYRSFNCQVDLNQEFEYVVCYSEDLYSALGGFNTINEAVKYLEAIAPDWESEVLEGELFIKSCLRGIQKRRKYFEEMNAFKSAFRKFLRLK